MTVERIQLAISIHSPARGETWRPAASPGWQGNFNPLAPHGARHPREHLPAAFQHHFNPLAPHGARLINTSIKTAASLFQSTRPARGETCTGRANHGLLKISIHSPRTGRDELPGYFFTLLWVFQSTRPARGETFVFFCVSLLSESFQSTRPARGETSCLCSPLRPGPYFNPLAPHGARRARSAFFVEAAVISIHSPRTGRDELLHSQEIADAVFQSTRPARGETGKLVPELLQLRISIHSPRTGRDIPNDVVIGGYFEFQSTRPARGETAKAHNLILFKLCVFDKK